MPNMSARVARTCGNFRRVVRGGTRQINVRNVEIFILNGQIMTPQTVIKLPATEIPIGVLDKPSFWVFLLAVAVLVILVRKK